MSKFHFNLFFILLTCLTLLSQIDTLYQRRIPTFMPNLYQFPQAAKNTVGEIPIIEQYDDGKISIKEEDETKYKGDSGGNVISFVTGFVTGGTITYINY